MEAKGDASLTWTRIADPDEASTLLPSWLGRLVGLRGRWGLLLATGDVLRITSLRAVVSSPEGACLLDVALDHAGVPEGVDLAWSQKHFLGAPVPGAVQATVNLSQLVAVVEFSATAGASGDDSKAGPSTAEVIADLERLTDAPAEATQRVAEPEA